MTAHKGTAINVPFTLDNFQKCRCPTCPVQTISQCMIEKVIKPEALNFDALKPQEFPAVYCAQGQATCTDIDPAKSCICTSCRVFAEYRLPKGQPVMYYCRDGKAHGK
jgi:hypothetical protein